MIINYRCSLLLADRVNSLQTPVIIDQSVEENSQFMESTSTISLLSITNTEEQIFNNETLMQKSMEGNRAQKSKLVSLSFRSCNHITRIVWACKLVFPDI